MRKSAISKLSVFLVILGVLLSLRGAVSQSEAAEVSAQIYLPLVSKNYPPITLTDIWVGNAGGYERSAFLPGEAVRYIVVGENGSDEQLSMDLQWHQTGPCGATDIFTGTLSVEPGLWVEVVQESAPACLGTYTNSVELTYESFKFTQETTFQVVDYTSEIVFSDKQGFDKCGLPTVEQMQTWWLESPYWVFNIYLGGSNFACNNPQLNADWVWQVSQQGWEFILTWVGPQSPCFDTIKPKISLNTGEAYNQGIEQADLAIAAAEGLGFTGDRIIYYDVEGYTDTDNQSCSNAVDAFITGWTARLHEQDFKAGAYGSPCRSYVGDWWDNQPLLDDIWSAYWLLPAQYRPDVTVWGNKCTLTDAMWANNQRLRQYAGDHYETWGPVAMTIDSNVLLGEIMAITTTTQAPAASLTPTGEPLADLRLHQARLLAADTGWALQGNRLLRTADAGRSWQAITPSQAEAILSVDFADAQIGWVVASNAQGELDLRQTRDGGATWQAASLPDFGPEVGALYVDLADAQTGWLVLKLVSSSSFSLGRLFATEDGGQTWEERAIPLGEPVQFSDALHGWVAGGPAGDEFYRTADGGRTWRSAEAWEYQSALTAFDLASQPENALQTSWADAQTAWVLTQTGSCSGEKAPASAETEPLRCWQQTTLLMTTDGGQTWAEITP